MSPDGAVDFSQVREYGPGIGVPRPVSANDPRIPAPAPDQVVWTDPGAPPLLVTAGGRPLQSVQQVTEDDVPKKIGIFAKRDGFAVAVLDDDNDPVEGGSYVFGAEDIVQRVKPLLEVAGHKVVDMTFGSLHEAASDGKVKPMRRKAADA